MPEVNEMQESYLEFITGKDGIAEKWIKAGAAGWRLDVCDELPDEFLKKLRACVGDKLLIGEVWEDASNKISYGVRRKYLHEGLLDGVMNYPFREAVLSYAMGGAAEEFKKKMETLRENYPRYVYYNCMNFLGTHDTERVLTVLGDERRVMLAAAIMFAFPGCPTIYYGDEVGLDGGRDPLNRRTYPWGRENERLKNYFSKLGMLRKESLALRRGSIKYIKAEDSLLCFEREYEGERMILAANTSNQEATFFGKIIAPVSAEIWRME